MLVDSYVTLLCCCEVHGTWSPDNYQNLQVAHEVLKVGQGKGHRVLCAGESGKFASLSALLGCWLRKDAWGRADSSAAIAPPADRSRLCQHHTFRVILAPLSMPHAWSNACAPVNAFCLLPICCLQGLWVNRGGGAPVRILGACLY